MSCFGNMKFTLAFLGSLMAWNLFPSMKGRRYDPSEENIYINKFLMADEYGEYIADLSEELPSQEKTTVDVTFYLYTQNERNHSDIIPVNEMQSLNLTKFDVNRKNVFTIHGWQNHYSSKFNVILKEVILKYHNVNLFVVDWSKFSKKHYYTAKKAVRFIGEYVGDFIYYIIVTYNLKPSDFFLIGHSLGAHVAGCAGTRVKTLSGNLINSIVGLDPARPLFTFRNTENRIDIDDADFVQIIHTNAGTLGFSSAIGDADYYPNGGSKQPGCGMDLKGTCSHSRAYYYYAESLLGFEFLARKCENFKSYTKGLCNSNHASYMGGLFIDKAAFGDYYLTNTSS